MQTPNSVPENLPAGVSPLERQGAMAVAADLSGVDVREVQSYYGCHLHPASMVDDLKLWDSGTTWQWTFQGEVLAMGGVFLKDGLSHGWLQATRQSLKAPVAFGLALARLMRRLRKGRQIFVIVDRRNKLHYHWLRRQPGWLSLPATPADLPPGGEWPWFDYGTLPAL